MIENTKNLLDAISKKFTVILVLEEFDHIIKLTYYANKFNEVEVNIFGPFLVWQTKVPSIVFLFHGNIL